MEPAVRAHYETVSDLYDEEEFLAEVQRRVDDAGGLLTPDVMALAVVDAEGRNEGAVVTIADIDDRSEATALVRVDRVFEVREFENKRGGGRVVNVGVHDATGAARLVLWNRDVEKAEDGTVQEGAILRVVNARVKRTSYGLELHVGRWSALEPEEEPKAEVLEWVTGNGSATHGHGNGHGNGIGGDAAADAGGVPATPLKDGRPGEFAPRVEATVLHVDPTRAFRRGDGSTGFVAKARLEDDSGLGWLTAWDDHVKALQDFSKGDRLVATDLSVREHRGSVEFHTTRGTTLARAED